jgi:hypothetical protein
MPQNPAQSSLYVSRIKAGAGVSITPKGGTGVITVSTAGGGSTPQVAYNAVATAPTANTLLLTGTNISGGSVKTVLNLTDALAAGANAELPTVAALVTALAALGITPEAGTSYELDIMNSSAGAFAWTVETNTGWTLAGTMTIAQNTLRKFVVTFTAAAAATLQSLGQYAFTGV